MNLRTVSQALAIALPAMVLAATPPLAGPERFLVGIGGLPCRTFTDNLQDEHVRQAYLAWAQGFLSGINVRGKAEAGETRNLPDVEDLGMVLRTRCAAQPDVSVDAVAQEIYLTRPLLLKIGR